jgi:glycosyltransferase involved in cell wall biosynthesis
MKLPFILFLCVVADLPTLHLIAPFHTVPSEHDSPCPFTGKVLRFSKMMRPLGWHIVEYHNGVSESLANEHIQILTATELEEFRNFDGNRSVFIGDDAVIGSALHSLFETRLVAKLKIKLKAGDIVLHPFSVSHKTVAEQFKEAIHVESGIGYAVTFLRFRIFESWAWYHYHHGLARSVGTASGSAYNWVIPNYYDTLDWPLMNTSVERPLVFMGRLVTIKGIGIVRQLAKRLPHRTFLVAGQGDFGKFFPASLTNVRYVGTLRGRERAQFLCTAAALLMPSSMIEPFGGSAVEAQMCGVPVITTNFGAFTETVEEGLSGYRCMTLGDYLSAIAAVASLDRVKIVERAHRLYSLAAVGQKYDASFRILRDVRNGRGWHTERSYSIALQQKCTSDMCK